MTAAADYGYAERMDAFRQKIAARKVRAILKQTVQPRLGRLLYRPGEIAGCGHTDPRLFRCIACGSTESLAPLIATVHLTRPASLTGGWRVRGPIETVPVAWECIVHDGFFDSPVQFEVHPWTEPGPPSWTGRKVKKAQVRRRRRG